jgi:hypothetical protein
MVPSRGYPCRQVARWPWLVCGVQGSSVGQSSASLQRCILRPPEGMAVGCSTAAVCAGAGRSAVYRRTACSCACTAAAHHRGENQSRRRRMQDCTLGSHGQHTKGGYLSSLPCTSLGGPFVCHSASSGGHCDCCCHWHVEVSGAEQCSADIHPQAGCW